MSEENETAEGEWKESDVVAAGRGQLSHPIYRNQNIAAAHNASLAQLRREVEEGREKYSQLHDLWRAECNKRAASQPEKPTGIEAQVCQDIASRQQKGIAKYGQTVAENPLNHAEWLNHAYEEALDLSVYLKAALASNKEPKP